MNEKIAMSEWNNTLLKSIIKIYDKTLVPEINPFMNKDTTLVVIARIRAL